MIVKNISIKVFKAGNKLSRTYRMAAGKHKQFTAEGIEKIVAEFAEKIDLEAPDQYRMAQIGPGQFNFVHKGC